MLYRIDGRDRRHVVVLVADDLTPAQEARAELAIEADLDTLARRFRRRDLEPVVELEDDDEDAPDDEDEDGVVLEVVR